MGIKTSKYTTCYMALSSGDSSTSKLIIIQGTLGFFGDIVVHVVFLIFYFFCRTILRILMLHLACNLLVPNTVLIKC